MAGSFLSAVCYKGSCAQRVLKRCTVKVICFADNSTHEENKEKELVIML